MVATGDATRAFGSFEYVASGTSGAFAASNPSDILSTVVSKMRPRYRADAIWCMAPATLATVSQWKDSGGRYILTPVTAPGLPPTLCGYPVVEMEHWPAVAASALAVGFVNFKRTYTIVDRAFGTRILRDPFTSPPYTIFRGTRRTTGAPVNTECGKFIKLSTS